VPARAAQGRMTKIAMVNKTHLMMAKWFLSRPKRVTLDIFSP
jgi:hypothetical protein